MNETRPEQRGLDLGLGCSARSAMIAVCALALIVAVLWLLLQIPDAGRNRELAQERAKALQPWNIALSITWRVVIIGTGIVFLAGLAGATRALVGILDNKRRTIQPRDGMMPARVLRRGESLADLNRSPDGKIQTAPTGWLAELLLQLLLGHQVANELSRPGVRILPHDTSPAQLQITSQAQVVQSFAANRGTLHQAAPALPLLQRTQQLPPLMALDQAPNEIRLLVEAGQRDWDQQHQALAELPFIEQLGQ